VTGTTNPQSTNGAPSSSKLSGGEIGGIVVGTVVGAIAITIIIAVLLYKLKILEIRHRSGVDAAEYELEERFKGSNQSTDIGGRLATL